VEILVICCLIEFEHGFVVKPKWPVHPRHARPRTSVLHRDRVHSARIKLKQRDGGPGVWKFGLR
jgi:hypothetical protein